MTEARWLTVIGAVTALTADCLRNTRTADYWAWCANRSIALEIPLYWKTSLRGVAKLSEISCVIAGQASVWTAASIAVIATVLANQSRSVGVIPRRTRWITLIGGIQIVANATADAVRLIQTFSTWFRTLGAYLSAIVKVAIPWIASFGFKHSKINTGRARKTFSVTAAGITIIGTLGAGTIHDICIKPRQTGSVTIVIFSEEVSHFTGCTIEQRNAKLAYGRTRNTGSGIVIEIAVLSHTPSNIRINKSEVVCCIAGNAGSVTVAGLAVVGTPAAD